ncbi:hypothetical protein E2C01_060013 [Portunus trituberculatus]|uniref:Uncharacterized protein n=1 Tax=Portunus trituberculatus TaxID=210409 RepID=A0A5B7HAU5_PORTR|nr:hypothetical protein [Portunus trituberculatus]
MRRWERDRLRTRGSGRREGGAGSSRLSSPPRLATPLTSPQEKEVGVPRCSARVPASPWRCIGRHLVYELNKSCVLDLRLGVVRLVTRRGEGSLGFQGEERGGERTTRGVDEREMGKVVEKLE